LKELLEKEEREKKYFKEKYEKEIATSNRFIIHKKFTILDTQTGLIWAKRDNGADIGSYHEAKDYCIHYQGGGYLDWRLPHINELENLYMHKLFFELFSISGYWLWTNDSIILDIHHGDKKRFSSTSYRCRVLPVRNR
jgi:hypothetical protein